MKTIPFAGKQTEGKTIELNCVWLAKQLPTCNCFSEAAGVPVQDK